MATDNNIKKITTADIEKYHKGLLSPGERHDLEKAALDDPFLADALEGYAVPGINPAADIAELKKKLADRVEGAKVISLPTTNRRSFTWLKAAAVVVFIAGAGLLVYQFGLNKKSGDSIAQAQPTKTKDKDSGNIIAPVSSGGITDKTVAKTTELKPGSQVATGNSSTLTVDATKGDVLSRNVSADSITTYYATVDNKAVAPPIVTVSPKGADGRNPQPGSFGKTEQEKDVAKEESKNKIAEDKKEAAKDETRNALEYPAEGFKQNRSVGAIRKQDEQSYRNIAANTFRGKVTDASNVGVPFARITNAQDNNAGTYTDARGYFNLTSPDTVLNVQVKSVGFENNNVQLRNNIPTNQVVLQDDRKTLSEVVISDQKPNAAARSHDANVKLEEPEPADGWENYDTYLTNNLNVPEGFKQKQSRDASVEISFEVDKNGEPVNIKVEKKLCPECDKEAIRLVKEGPKWKRKAKKGRTTVTIPFYSL